MAAEGRGLCINEILTDDELRAVVAKLERQSEKDVFGLVCKRWLRIQSTERLRLRARAGPAMLRRLAGRFSELLVLDLSQSTSRSFFPGVVDDDLAMIAAGFRNLRVLNLYNCKGVTDSGLTKVGHDLPSLESLDVSHCRKLTDKGLTAIALGCCNLKIFCLPGCKSVTDKLLHALSENCLHLEELGLEGCNSITNSGLLVLADGCQHIRSLDISKCSKIEDSGVCRIAEASSSSLISLKLLDCCKISDKSIFTLAQSCHNLETLVLGGCRDVTDESIESLALACSRSLRNLRMDWCLRITDLSLRHLLSNCRRLEALDLGCCDKVTDLAFQDLEGKGFDSGLKFFKLNNCLRITTFGVSMILQWFKELEYLDLRSCPNTTRLACEEAGLQFPECCRVNFDGSLLEMDRIISRFF